MQILYTLAIFLSALLLFSVQPLFARMALPLLGGSPAVWNTALVFYQAALLAGYAYAHFSTRWLGPRRQAALHIAVLALPLLALPIGIPAGWSPPGDSSPIPWLLTVLLVGVGLPFFTVSATSPLLQRWFAASGHPRAADPYFFYAASNIGSTLALLSYPFLIEPRLRLQTQSEGWSWGYGLLALLIAGCAVALWRQPALAEAHADAVAPPIRGARRLRWVALAFVPASLLTSVTTFLSTDIAAIPLLWIIPLSLYLLSFSLVFAARPLIPHWIALRALPMVLLPLVIALCARANQPIQLIIGLHLVVFFVVAMVCHGELARDRPHAARLTEFYLLQSLGGVLGGLFAGLVAPLLFTNVTEYPIILVLACLLAPLGSVGGERRARALDVVLPVGLGLLVAGLVLAVGYLKLPAGPQLFALAFGAPALICFSFSRRPVRLALGVVAMLAGASLYLGPAGRPIFAERSFFGVSRVTISDDATSHLLFHGSTLHGVEDLSAKGRPVPLTYYYPTGPIGQVFAAHGSRLRSVAVVGLGTGTLSCYRAPGQEWTYYEIDPTVEAIARNPQYFTYLQQCDPQAHIVLGDARLSLSQTDARYDLIILDAYSSDSIPVHLLTREALRVYTERLAPGGLLAFHISNVHLRLEPVVADLSADAGLVALVNNNVAISPEENKLGKAASEWALVARSSTDFGKLAGDSRWYPARGIGATLWTDDFSSLLSVME